MGSVTREAVVQLRSQCQQGVMAGRKALERTARSSPHTSSLEVVPGRSHVPDPDTGKVEAAWRGGPSSCVPQLGSNHTPCGGCPAAQFPGHREDSALASGAESGPGPGTRGRGPCSIWFFLKLTRLPLSTSNDFSLFSCVYFSGI